MEIPFVEHHHLNHHIPMLKAMVCTGSDKTHTLEIALQAWPGTRESNVAHHVYYITIRRHA